MTRIRQSDLLVQIRHGMRSFASSPALWLIVALVGIINWAQNSDSRFQEFSTSNGWIFEKLPGLLQDILSVRGIVAIIAILCITAYLDVVAGVSMFLSYRQEPSSLKTILRAANPAKIFWFAKTQILSTLFFALIALICYFAAYAIWSTAHTDLSVALIFGAAILYPLYYSLAAFSAMLSAFPWSEADRWDELRWIIFSPRRLASIYTIYGLRLAAELLLVYGATLLSKELVRNSTASGLLVIGALILPLLVVRGATYGATLRVLRQQHRVSILFDERSDAGGAKD
jgi:hypothetical protein